MIFMKDHRSHGFLKHVHDLKMQSAENIWQDSKSYIPHLPISKGPEHVRSNIFF